MSFVHLHLHSHYSLLDGLPKIPEIIRRTKEMNMNAVALTDHGAMYGCLEFYKNCRSEGIKPIIGVEAYIAKNSLHLKRTKIDDISFHILLLAYNKTGYYNLIKLTTIGHLDGFYYKPRIDKKILKKYSEGLICLSGCSGGEIPQAIIKGNLDLAGELTKDYSEIFGPNNFYIELQRHSPVDPQKQIEEKKLEHYLMKLAADYKLPIVATNDVHYLNPQDTEAQEALMCIQTGKILEDEKRLSMKGLDLSFASQEEMKQKFIDIPEAIANTVHIANRCNLEIPIGKWNFPAYEIPKESTANKLLREKALKGLKKRVGTISEKQKNRLYYELEIIEKKGYTTYFLVVADFVNWARDRGIVTTTRGSAAGSLVSYAIGITTLNPLEYKLPFERFLNPERPVAPDIDVDLADDKRDEVIKYVIQKYGRRKVAKIVTFGTMLARAAVRDVTRVLDLPYNFGDKIAKLIPFGSQGFPMTIKKALDINPELKNLYENDNQVKRVINLAQKIEGCARHASVHAAGVVIAPTELTDYVPLQKEAKGGLDITTQYDMHSCESAGLVKIDFLGIRNLSILGKSIKIVKKQKNVDIDLENIPLDDKKTYKLLSSGETIGLFQLGGSGMTRYLKELKASTIFDIMAMVALYRPGPMDSIPEYIRRKHGKSPVTYLVPELKEILDQSFGILVYQDDVLMTAIKIAGYTWLEADKLRKAMGKKIPAEMATQREKFITGCMTKSKLTEHKAKQLWKLIEPFAAYGFNKAHAASYARVAYQTAYMKAHFPAEFMTAVMTAECDNNDKIAEAVKECTHLGIKVLPPDINKSRADFTFVSDSEIRFGLNAVKNLGSDIIHFVIIDRKEHGIYKNLADFIKRTCKAVNKKSIEALIKSGALDLFGERNQMLENIDRLLAYARAQNKQLNSRQASLFGSIEQNGSELTLAPAKPAPDELKLAWEKELLGLYVSGHPMKEWLDKLPNHYTPIRDITKVNESITTAGIITESKKILTRKNQQMVFANIEDTTGSIEIIIFPSVYQKKPDMWEPENIVALIGKVSDKDGEIKILVDTAEALTSSIEPNQQIRANASFHSKLSTIHITLPSAFDASLNKQLKDIVKSHPGQYKISLIITSDGRTSRIDTNLSMEYNEITKEKIENFLGKGSITLIK